MTLVIQRVTVLVIITAIYFVPTAVFAQGGQGVVPPGGGGGGGGGGIQNPLNGVSSIEDLLVDIANWLLGLVAILSLIGIVMSGIRMVIAVGNDQAVASAKKILFWSVAGLVVAALALTIVSIVAEEILGVSGSWPLVGNPVFAADIGLDDAAKVNLNKQTPKTVASNAVNFIASIAGVLALAVIIWGGVMYILSLGDDQKVATAKKIIFNGVVGLMIVVGAFVILRGVLLILGVGVVPFA